METFAITGVAELQGIAKRVIRDAAAAPLGAAAVVSLSGELGSGKTTFTQTLARALGITDAVTSPTFVVMKRYPFQHERFNTLVHIDFYRIDNETEFAPLRLAEEYSNERNLIIVEWPERGHNTIPPHALTLSFAVNDDGSRTITYGR